MSQQVSWIDRLFGRSTRVDSQPHGGDYAAYVERLSSGRARTVQSGLAQESSAWPTADEAESSAPFLPAQFQSAQPKSVEAAPALEISRRSAPSAAPAGFVSPSFELDDEDDQSELMTPQERQVFEQKLLRLKHDAVLLRQIDEDDLIDMLDLLEELLIDCDQYPNPQSHQHHLQMQELIADELERRGELEEDPPEQPDASHEVQGPRSPQAKSWLAMVFLRWLPHIILTALVLAFIPQLTLALPVVFWLFRKRK